MEKGKEDLRTLYLAHPFNSRDFIRQWETTSGATFPIKLVNPFYHPKSYEVFELKDMSGDEYYKKLAHYKEIVESDIELIKKSDGVIAVVDGALSYGTIMEIAYSKIYNKPVYLIITNGHHNHLWFKYHATKIFTSFKEFEEFIKNEKI